MSVWKKQQVAVFFKTWLIGVMMAALLGSAVLLGTDIGQRNHGMPACTAGVPMMVNVLPDIRC